MEETGVTLGNEEGASGQKDEEAQTVSWKAPERVELG